MVIAFTDHGWEDYCYWQAQHKETSERINVLIRDIKRDPFKGIGKPEPLKGKLAGSWSRRITDEHRLVYRVRGTGKDQTLEIMQARFHY